MGPNIERGSVGRKSWLTPWAWTGLLLLLLGLVITVASGFSMRAEVIGEGSMVIEDGWHEMGPYEISGGTVQVWFEDYYPGDDWENYDVYASEDEWDNWWGNPPFSARTRDFDGVECELVASIEGLPAGKWMISIESYGDAADRDDRVRIYVVRTGGAAATIGFGMGLSMLFMGAILTLLVMWPRLSGKEATTKR